MHSNNFATLKQVLDFPEIRECTGKLVKLAVQRGLLKPSYLAVDATSHV